MIINSKAGKSFRVWAGTCAAVNAKKAKMKAALAVITPEGRAMKHAFRQIAWIRKRQMAMQVALNRFRLAGCRSFFSRVNAQLAFLRKLRKGAMSIFLRKQRLVWNVWTELASAARSRKSKMAGAAMKLTPEGRMMNYGWQAFVEMLDMRQQMRAAASGFVMGSQKRAMSAWIEATFAVRVDLSCQSLSHVVSNLATESCSVSSLPPSLVPHLLSSDSFPLSIFSLLLCCPLCSTQAFHIASGLDGHTRWRIRKAIQQWVARAHIRKGLRRQVFVTALKGTALRTLLNMMDDADTDDLSNAILARDREGCTPLLIAAKKGFIDVVEAIISSGANCAEKLQDESLLSEIVDTKDGDGNSPLHWAARKGWMEVAEALLEAQANVNIRNAEGATPLHWAARKNNLELLEMLLQAGADPTLINKWGATPLQQAVSFQQDVAAQRLQAEEKKSKKPPASAALAAMDAAKYGGQPPPKQPATKHQPAAKPAWGEGPGDQGLSLAQPMALKQERQRRKAEADRRRIEAQETRAKQEEDKAKDLENRRQKQELELRLKDLLDNLQGPLGRVTSSGAFLAGKPAPKAQEQARDVAKQPRRSKTPEQRQGRQQRRSPEEKANVGRSRSPPKPKLIKELAQVIEAARTAGCAAPLLEMATANLQQAKAMAKAAAEAKKDKSPPGGKKAGGGDDMDKEMRRMEKKLGR